MKWIVVFISLFMLTACFDKAPQQKSYSAKKMKVLTEDQKGLMRAVEEKSIRLVALDIGVSCENLPSFYEKASGTLGLKELLNFVKAECEGAEPGLPTRIPAKCRDQVEIPPESIGGVPGLEVNSDDVRKHNLSQCGCPAEYKLIEEGKLPLCLLNIVTS